MAKAPTSDSIMAADKMKPLLALSKREPVHAAVGLTADGEGIILLDKKAKPKKVFSMLKASAGKAKIQLNTASLRFGRAEVDTDYDSGMVRFFINKDAPGNLRAKLVEVVKRIPYQKVEINVDPSLEEEPEEDGDGEEASAAPGAATANGAAPPAAPPQPMQAAVPAAPPPPAAPDPALAALRAELAQLIPQINTAAGDDAERARAMKMDAAEANNQIKLGNVAGATDALQRLKGLLGTGAEQAAPTGQPLHADALQKELAGLIGRIAQAAGDDAARKASLVTLATQGNTNIKANNLEAAAQSIAGLRAALDAPAANGAPAAKVWTDAKDAVDQQLEGLYSVLKKTGLPALNAIAGEIESVLGEFRVGLITSLMNYDSANGAAKEPARTAALKVIDQYKTRLTTDKHVIGADKNPFGVPVTVNTTLGAALDKLHGQLAA